MLFMCPWRCVCLFQTRSYVVCMNHTKLIEALLLNAGVPDDKLSAVMETLVAHQVRVDCIFWQLGVFVWIVTYIVSAQEESSSVYRSLEKFTYCTHSASAEEVKVYFHVHWIEQKPVYT